MSKTMLAGIIAVLLISGLIVFNSQKSKNIENPNMETNTGNTAETNDRKMAFGDFVKQGGSYKCNVTQNVGGTSTNGITYISGGMINGEYATSVNGMNITSNVIVRDGFTYSWSSMMPNIGFKAKVVANTDANTNTGASGTYSFNADQIGEYSCEEWVADESKFNLPIGVTFQQI